MDPERDRGSSRHPTLARARRRFRPPRSLRATRAGYCFVAIIFGVGFAALNTGNNLLYLVFALMLAFLVLSGLLSEASLRGIRVERRLPRELFAAAANRVVLRVENAQRRVASFAISIEDQLGADGAAREAGRCFALRIGPGEHVERSYTLAPDRRGDLEFESIRVSTRFPFGLFVKSVDFDLPRTALVYPEIRTVAAVERHVEDGLEQEDRPGASRDGDEIAGLREYVAGDAFGRVHWRRSLRSRRLLVGEREGHAAAEIEVLLRLPATLSAAHVEDHVSRAASEIVHHLDAGLRVGLRTRAVRFAPDTGLFHRCELLAFLARVTPERAEGEPDRDVASERAR